MVRVRNNICLLYPSSDVIEFQIKIHRVHIGVRYLGYRMYLSLV